MRVGIESCYGFGDGLFNVPLIQAISARYGTRVDVAVRADCADAFENVPAVRQTVHCSGLHDGHATFQRMGYDVTLQITQNVKFFEFREHDPAHSLVHTPSKTGAQLGLQPFNHRPQIYLRQSEKNWAHDWMSDKRQAVMVEAVFKSGQSWCDAKAVRMIMEANHGKKVIWASHTTPPAGATPVPASRRHVIACLPYCSKFYSVGSGFFCASLALEEKPPTTCLWIDDLYKYEQHIPKEWSDVTWVHSHKELADVL